jgi:hypothetical protein
MSWRNSEVHNYVILRSRQNTGIFYYAISLSSISIVKDFSPVDVIRVQTSSISSKDVFQFLDYVQLHNSGMAVEAKFHGLGCPGSHSLN